MLRCRVNVRIVMCQFVPNSLSYVSAKYYSNWFTVEVLMNKRVGLRCSLLDTFKLAIRSRFELFRETYRELF